MASRNDLMMSFYRKYRPQTFAHLVGQSHINQTILNALKLDRVSHAYLFTGPRGTGKTSAARLLAKAINCTDLKDNEPCNACEICNDINDGRLIDLIEIDAASNRGIDEIRDLREKINFAPTRAKSKVYIIDEVHMLTKEAFNALLKTLEEPPAHVYFILATTEVHKIPETILSRCQRFDFKRIDDVVIMERLKYIAKEESIEVDETALDVIVHHAEGGLRDAIGLLEQLTSDNSLSYDNVCNVLGISGFQSLEKLYSYLENNDVKEAINEINELYMEGNDLTYFNKRFLEFLRKKMIKSVNENNPAQTDRIIKLIENFQESYGRSRYSTIQQLPLEMAVVKSCEVEIKSENPTKTQDLNTEVPKSPVQQEEQSAPSINVRDHQPLTAPSDNIQNTPAAESAEKKSLNLEIIKKDWRRVGESINNPIAKRSLMSCTPVDVCSNNLTLGFASNFHMEKVMEIENKTAIEHAVLEVFGTNLKLLGEIKKVEMATPTPKEPSIDRDSIKTTDHKPPSLEETVLNMFDGELA